MRADELVKTPRSDPEPRLSDVPLRALDYIDSIPTPDNNTRPDHQFIIIPLCAILDNGLIVLRSGFVSESRVDSSDYGRLNRAR